MQQPACTTPPGAGRTRGAARRALALPLALGLAQFVMGAQAAQLLLDRVLARVGTAVITASDVRAAVGLGLVDTPAADEAALERLIDRQIILDEVARFQPPDPPPADIDAEVAAMRTRAGNRLDALMRDTGLDEDRLRELARDTLRIRAYVRQRFGAAVDPSADEVRRWVSDLRQRAAISRIPPRP